MQGTRQHSASFITIATTAVVSVLRFAADADLLWPMAALLFAIGQVFTVASRSWLFHFVAPSSPALIALFGGGIGSLHLRLQAFTLRLAPVYFFRLRFRSPMPEERGTEKRRRNLSEPFPPTPSRHYKREREQVACGEVTANRRHPAAARCVALSLSASVLQQRLRMERRHQ